MTTYLWTMLVLYMLSIGGNLMNIVSYNYPRTTTITRPISDLIGAIFSGLMYAWVAYLLAST